VWPQPTDTSEPIIAELLRAQGIAGCWVTLERCQGIEDLERAESLWIQALDPWSQDLPAAWRAPHRALFAAEAVGGRLGAYIRAWAASLDVPLVLLLDEADVVPGPVRNFNAQEVGELLRQHTAETGQPFLPEAVGEIARVTDGQPLLVNALPDLCVRHLVPERRDVPRRRRAGARAAPRLSPVLPPEGRVRGGDLSRGAPPVDTRRPGGRG
jgi:hypothetical protein